MAMENKRDENQAEVDFKNLVFANNPQLYKALFIDKPEVDPDQVEWIRPRSPEEVKEALEELKQFGLNFNLEDDYPRDQSLSGMDDMGTVGASELGTGTVDAFEALGDEDE
jgi:hypothetical protein